MGEFDGAFYVSVDNPRQGGQLFSTRDGHAWARELTAGGDAPLNRAFLGFQQFESGLWLATVTRAPPGASVFEAEKLTDGEVGYGEMNLPGFGDPTTGGGSPDLAVLNDALWWGGENAGTGAQVWRLAADDLRRATATGPGVEIPTAPIRLTSAGRLPVTITCPAEDPYGCHGDLEVRTVKRFADGGRRRHLLLASKVYEMPAGRTRTFSFRLPPDLVRLLRPRLPIRIDVHAVAFDNARNARATILLRG